MTKYEIHDACAIFPQCSDEDFAALMASIEKDGLLEPIRLFEGKILDGRSRYTACRAAKVEPFFVEVAPEDPIAAVLAWNLARRHLDASQKAMVAAAVRHLSEPAATARMEAGAQNCARGKSAEIAAKAVGVSTRSVEHAIQVREHAPPEVVAAVEAGKVKVSDAAKIADKPKPQQRAALKAVEKGEAKTLAEAAKPKKREPKNGREVGDFKGLNDLLGKATRKADDVNRERPGAKFHKKFMDSIEGCFDAVKDWKEATR